MSAPDRIVVAGGGIGGVATTTALRRGGYSGEVVLVDPAPLPYDRPPLSKSYLAGGRDLREIALQPPEWYDTHDVRLLSERRVAALHLEDDEAPVAVLDDGSELRSDRVVLATGGRPALPPVPGLAAGAEAGRVHVLREASDADRLRTALRPGATLLVVGGGLIGAETASTARSIGCQVILVDPLDPPLAKVIGAEVAAWLHAEHRTRGVETVVGVLDSIEVTPEGVLAQLSGDAAPRRVDVVLVGVGMLPDTTLAKDAGLRVDRGIVVDDRQVTSHPRVLAVGDCARPAGRHRAEHWEAAKHDGRRAAATILAQPSPAETVPWWWSDRHGRHVEGVGDMGISDPTSDLVLRGVLGDPPFAMFAVRGRRVVGAVAVDDSKAVRVARRLIDNAIQVDAHQLADPATDLRRLLKG